MMSKEYLDKLEELIDECDTFISDAHMATDSMALSIFIIAITGVVLILLSIVN